MGSELFVAAVLAAVALAAAMLSVEAGLSVAVIEIVAGVVVGNVLHLSTPDWLVFLFVPLSAAHQLRLLPPIAAFLPSVVRQQVSGGAYLGNLGRGAVTR